MTRIAAAVAALLAAAPGHAGRVLFEGPLAFAPGGEIREVLVADLDNDGAPDTACSGRGLVVRRNDGFGSLALTTYEPVLTTTVIRGIHLDGDGLLDLVLLAGVNNVPLFWRNTGACTFELATIPNVAAAANIAVADADGDGDDDLFAVVVGASSAQIYLRTGNSTFATGGTLSFPEEIQGFDSLDADGDGRRDLIALTATGAHVRLASPGGGFSDPATTPVGLGGNRFVRFDLDGNALADIAVFRDFSSRFTVLRGTGGGAFEEALPVTAPTSLLGLAAFDWNRDDLEDLIAAPISGESTLYLRSGDTFAAGTALRINTFRASASADLDRDGRLDLVTGASDSNASLLVHYSREKGLTQPTFVSRGSSPKSIVLANLFGDDRAEVVRRDGPSFLLVDQFDTSGTLTVAASYNITQGSSAFELASQVIDIEGDGRDEILFFETSPAGVRVVTSDGAATLDGSNVSTTALTPFGAVGGKFRNDGDLSVFLSDSQPRVHLLTRPNASSVLVFREELKTPVAPGGLSAARMDAGASADIFYSGGNGTFFFHRNSGSGPFGGAEQISVLPGTQTMPPVPVPGDGEYDDLIVFGSSNNARAYAKNNGTGVFTVMSQPLDYPAQIFATVLDGEGAERTIGYWDGVSRTFGTMELAADGTFGETTSFANPSGLAGVRFGRIDGDALPDAVVGGAFTLEYAIVRNLSGDTEPPTAQMLSAPGFVGTGEIAGTFAAEDAGIGVQFGTLYRQEPGGAWQVLRDAAPKGSAWSIPVSETGVYRFAAAARDYLGNTSPLPEEGAQVLAVAYNATPNAPFAHEIGEAGQYVFPMEPGANVVVTAPAGLGGSTVTVERIMGPQSFPGQGEGFAPLRVRISATGAAATTPMPIRIEFAGDDLGAFPAASLARVYRQTGAGVEGIAATGDATALEFVATPSGDFVPGTAGALGFGWIVGGE